MIQIALQIEPRFYGPISVGSIEVIQLIRETFGFGLPEAKGYVDRCVFDGERVLIPASTREVATRFVDALRTLKTPTKFEVEILGSDQERSNDPHFA